MVVLLVEGWVGIADVAVPLIMGGRANLLDLGGYTDHPLVFDVHLCLLGRELLPRCVPTFSSIVHLAGSLGDALDFFILFCDGGWR